MSLKKEKQSKSSSLFCIKTRNQKDFSFSPIHKWTIYITGLVETFIFSGCVFGWGPMVYILKKENVFANLCQDQINVGSMNGTLLGNNGTEVKKSALTGCSEQDKEFAFIYTITIFVYSTPNFVCGLILHHAGLVVARIIGSLLLIVGLVALGLTTQDHSHWLYSAMIFIALGSSQMRLAAFQFCDLFPKFRSTALTIISGTYAASPGLFLIFQVAQKYGLTVWIMSLILLAFAVFSFIITPIMPWHHVPHEGDKTNVQKITKTPLMKSIISFSSLVHFYFLLITVSNLSFYSINFNPWISKISETEEEAGHYTLIYSICSFACIIVTPFPGLLFDFLLRLALKAKTPEKRLLNTLMCPIPPLLIVISLSAALVCCYYFNTSIAVYTSIFILMILRPSLLSVAGATLRIRFPPEQFDRLFGLYGTAISFTFLLQYPFFVWYQDKFIQATSTFLALMILTSVYPLHFLSRRYRMKVIKDALKPLEKCEEIALNEEKR